MGGFLAAMVAAQGIGVLLDVSSGGGAFQWSDFRVAWAAIVAVWVLGMVGLLTSMAMRRRIERRAVELEAP